MILENVNDLQHVKNYNNYVLSTFISSHMVENYKSYACICIKRATYNNQIVQLFHAFIQNTNQLLQCLKVK